VTELIVKGGLAYLLGSLVGSLLLGHFRGIDIRSLGSGNAGATNALRTQGWRWGLPVLVIDLAKGWIAVRWLAPAALPGLPAAAPELAGWSAMVCGIAVILGHVYPLWYGFRGGKGVATFVGVVSGISASLLLVLVPTWLVAVILFGYVGLASMLAAVAVAIAIAAGTLSPRVPLLAFGVVAALLILYTHRGNIERMRAGTESRAKRLWLLGIRRGRR
jgi:acyl phosphate:glycerol-3-phosphate acyltransferase